MELHSREPEEYRANIPARVLVFLVSSFYILGIPCFGAPIMKSFFLFEACRAGLKGAAVRLCCQLSYPNARDLSSPYLHHMLSEFRVLI